MALIAPRFTEGMALKLFFVVAALFFTVPAYAYEQYPAPSPAYLFQRSVLSPRLVTIPPYGPAFHVRVYNTPPRQPYYNVPPFAVISPD